MNSKKNKSISKDPLILIIHFLLAGIVILFIGIGYGYIFSENKDKWIAFQVPKIFWASTAVLLITSIMIRQMNINYKRDKMSFLKFNLLSSILFGIIFCIFQVKGFLQLQQIGFNISSTPSASYLYVFAILHLLHMLFGIIFLIVAFYNASKFSKDNVKELLYFSDQKRRVKLKLLAQYWFTIDFIWFGIFILILYTHA